MALTDGLEAEAVVAALSGAGGVAWLTSGADGRITSATPGFGRWFECDADALTGRPLAEVLAEVVAPRLAVPEAFLARAAAPTPATGPGNLDDTARQFQVAAPGESPRWFWYHTQPMAGAHLAGGRLDLFVDISLLKQEERAHQESEQSWRDLLDHLPDGVIVTDSESRVVDVNETACRMFGYCAEDLVGRPLADIVDVSPERGGPMKLDLQAGESKVVQRWMLCGDGTPLPVEVHVRRAPNGRWHGVLRDARARLAAEQRLRESEARYRRLMRQASDAILVSAPDGTFLDANPRAAELLGYPLDELIGLDGRTLIPPEELHRQPLQIARIRAGERVVEERNVLRRDGSQLQVEMSVIQLDNGLVESIVRDISARKRVEAELRVSEARYRHLVEHAPVAIMLVRRGLVVYANAAAVDMLHAEGADAVEGRSLKALAHIHNRPVARAALQQAEQTGVPTGPLEVSLTRLDGTRGHTQIVALPFTIRGERALQVVGTDITARKEAEQRLRQVNEELEARVRERTAELEAATRELEAFTYALSHDLRAPVRHLLGFSSLLRDEYHEQLDERAREYLDALVRAGQRIDGLITDLLPLARVSRQALAPSPVDLGALVREAVEEVAASEPEREVEVSIAPDAVAVGDEGLLRVALANLLRNAWKFTRREQHARIEFGRGEVGGETVWWVRDNGVGFNPEHADKLFRPFQRLHPRDEFDGTGLGLPMVERIIHRHGGRVWAEGAEGCGATFYFTLPGERPVPPLADDGADGGGGEGGADQAAAGER